MSQSKLTRDRGFVVSCVIALVVGLGFGLVVPVVPAFARSFGVGLFAASAIVSAFPAVRLVSNLITGALTDRIGKRRAVGYGALIVAASSALSAVAPTYLAFLLARGSGGFGSALFFNALLALVIVAVPPEQRGRAVGGLQGAFLAGIALGPGIGGALSGTLGLRWPFAVYALFCAAAGAVALLFLPRAREATTSDAAAEPAADLVADMAPEAVRGPTALRAPGAWSVLRQLLARREFVVALVLMAASRYALTGVRFALVPLFGQEVVGVSAAVVGYGLVLAALTHLAVVWPAGRIADTRGRRALAWPAYLLFAAASAALGLATSAWAFLLLLALYGVGTGLSGISPPAIVGDVVAARHSGIGIGALNTAGDLGSVVGPLLAGWVAEIAGFGWAFSLSGMVLAAAAVAAWSMRETLPGRGGGDLPEPGPAADDAEDASDAPAA